MSKDSILWWVIITYKSRITQYRKAMADGLFVDTEFIEFKDPKKTDEWLESL